MTSVGDAHEGDTRSAGGSGGRLFGDGNPARIVLLTRCCFGIVPPDPVNILYIYTTTIFKSNMEEIVENIFTTASGCSIAIAFLIVKGRLRING